MHFLGLTVVLQIFLKLLIDWRPLPVEIDTVPGGEHAVRLAGAEGREVVDEDADVALSPVHDQGIPPENAAAGVDASHYALILAK